MSQTRRRNHSKLGSLAAVTILAVSLGILSTGCAFVKARVEMKKGNESYNTDHFEEAVEHYQAALQINPTYKDAYVNMGLAYLSLYQPGSTHEKDIMYSSNAIGAFKDYLRLDPGNEKVVSFLIETSQRSNNEEAAIDFFAGEHRRHPDDVRTINYLGNLFTKLGDIDSGIEWMQKRIDLEPDNPEAYYTMGVNCWARSYNHMDLSQEDRFTILDRGIAALDRAIELKPLYFEAYTYKNLILRQKAGFETSPGMRVIYTNQADEYLKKAQEIRQAQQREAEAQAEKEAAEAAAGGI